jgi:ornithine cyclodeaminase/alanine dehydrogenase-like protein (mu-crystallin family)
MTLYLDDDDVVALLPMEDAVACVDSAFRLLSDASAVNEVRHRTETPDVALNVMWAIVPSAGVLGVKSYSVVRRDVSQGAVLTLLLYSVETGELLSVIKADRLGQLRTGAATAVATRTLAGPHAETLAIYGTGFQAETQVLALAATVPGLRTARVVGRSPERRDEFTARMRTLVHVDVGTAEPEEAARGADIVVTATGSAEPVVRGDWLTPGSHVNAVGSNLATKRELDRALLKRASVIVVDDHAAALNECGDLIANGWDQDEVVALGDVLTGRAAGRRDHSEVTVFESHGLAVQDVACAALVHERAVAAGVGRRLGRAV